MKNINKIIKEEIDKFIIKESLSSKLYHFTNIFNLMNIIHNNSFKLSFAQKDNGERGQYSKYQYYMCFTRQRDGRVGFADGHNVRIEIDGDLLNQNYKGKPTNFWGESGGINHYMNNLKDYNDYYVSNGDMEDEIKFQRFNETEDRLFSNTPSIPNARKYIKRIDIIVDNYDFNPMFDWLLIESDYKDVIHFYDNEKDFNSFNGKDINRKFMSHINAKLFNADNYNFIKKDANMLEDLSIIFTYLMFINNVSIQDCNNYINKIMKQYEINNININEIIIKTIAYYNDLLDKSNNDINTFKINIMEEIEYAASDIGNCKDIALAKKIANMIRHEDK